MQYGEQLYKYYHYVKLNNSIAALSKISFLQNAVTERSDV